MGSMDFDGRLFDIFEFCHYFEVHPYAPLLRGLFYLLHFL